MLKITLALLAAFGAVLLIVLAVHPLRENGLDFQAFYCGAKVLGAHANPYLNQPLHDCEKAGSPAFFALYPNVTVPAPLPPYALAAFLPLTLLPFAAAKALWFVALVAATVLCAVLTARLARLPLAVAAAACCVAILGPSILQFALAPVSIALLILTASFASDRRWNAAAAAMTLSMIEPHVALPAALALFAFVPAMRLRLCAGAAFLALLSVVLCGAKTFVWYLTVLLPAHAGSELNNLGQFSLTTLLYHAGVAAPLALRLGTLQYAFMLVLGIYLAYALSKRCGEPAFLVLAPAACSVVGGSFIHLTEIAIAIPLMCVLAGRFEIKAAWPVVCLLAVPWEAIFNWGFLAPFAAIGAIWLIAYRWKPLPVLLPLGALAFILVSLRMHVASVTEFQSVHAKSIHIPAASAGALSDVTWAAFNATLPASPYWWAEKSLTLAALGMLVIVAIATARSRQPQTSVI